MVLYAQKKVSCLMSLVYALRHQRILYSSDVSCCCVNGLRLLYTLTCKHVIAIKKYVFKGAIILIPLFRPGVFSNISKRWRLPENPEQLVKPCCTEPVLILEALLASISGWLGQYYLPLIVRQQRAHSDYNPCGKIHLWWIHQHIME